MPQSVFSKSTQTLFISESADKTITQKIKEKHEIFDGILEPEEEIVDFIQLAYNRFDGIIINAGAYTHTSIAILDALKSSNVKAVEVHITNVLEREEFRHFSYVGLYAEKSIIGKGLDGYNLAIDYIMGNK